MVDRSTHSTAAEGATSAAPGAGLDLAERLRRVTMGEHEILAELGRGGMATVFLAHEIALDRKVAIKVMAPMFSHGEGMADRFKREAKTAASLSHPNIIPIYAVREGEGLLFFVMKLIKGTTLDQVVTELRQLPIPTVEALLGQVGGALGYAHRHGVVHRDVKPGNVMIDEEGWAVVTDFGIAKVDQAEGLTMTGMAVGTPLYMSPEQCAGGPITGASDQYSLGAVAFEMITGRPPFAGSGMMPVMFSHCNDPVPSIAALRPDCPEPLRHAVERMLAKKAADRWPSVEDAVAAIGLRTLAHDDPARSQLVALARTGSGNRIVARIQTPRSPVPRGGRTTVSETGKPAPWTVPGWVKGAGLLAAGAVVALGATILWSRDSPETPSVGGPRPDSAAKVSIVAPAPAPTAPLPVAPPPAVPGARAPGERLTRTAGTTVIAPSAPTAAVQVPPTATIQQPDSSALTPAESVLAGAVPRVKPVDPPAAAPRVPESQIVGLVSERTAIETAVHSYSRALSAGDLDAALRVYPGLSGKERETYEGFWKSGGTMRAQWSVSDLQISGNTATARVTGTTEFRAPGGRPDAQRVGLQARFERRVTGWIIVSLAN